MFYFVFMCFEKLSIKATGSIYVKHNTLINAACPQFIIFVWGFELPHVLKGSSFGKQQQQQKTKKKKNSLSVKFMQN